MRGDSALSLRRVRKPESLPSGRGRAWHVIESPSVGFYPPRSVADAASNGAVRDALEAKGLLSTDDSALETLERLDLTDAHKRDERFYPPAAVVG